MVVSMHYTLTDEAGNEIDSSVGSDPMMFEKLLRKNSHTATS